MDKSLLLLDNLSTLGLEDVHILQNGMQNVQPLMASNELSENFSISVDYQHEMQTMLSSLYDNESAVTLGNNSQILNLLEPLKHSPDSKSVYESVLTLVNSADKFNSLMTDMKMLQGDVITQLKILNEKFHNKFYNLVRAFARDAEVEYDEENFDKRLVKKILDSVDMSRFLEKCDQKIESLRTLNEKLKNVFDFSGQRENLVRVLGQENTRKKLDDYDDDIKEQSSLVDKQDKQLAKKLIELVEIDNELNFNTLKKKQIDKLIDQNEKLANDLKADVDKLKASRNENETKIKEILSNVSDPIKIKDMIDKEKSIRDEFDHLYVKTVFDIVEKTNELNKEIAEIKQVHKSFNLVFVLDESGSMESHFPTVKKSVMKIVQDRRSHPATKDKVSVILFNDKARVEILNASVNDIIKLPDCQGGSTKFVPALQELDTILQETDADLFIPIVFFLSDGYGESTHLVTNKCKEIRNKHTRLNMLFFSVGYGDKADQNTLESMAVIFNNSKTFLTIGEEKCKLYQNAKNDRELVKSFTVFEKLFRYQVNIVKTKTDMFKSLLKQKEDEGKQTRTCLDQIFENRKEFKQKQERQVQDEVDSIGQMNTLVDENLQHIDKQLADLQTAKDTLQFEKNKCESEISLIFAKKEQLEKNVTLIKQDLESSRKKLNQLNEKKTNETDEMLNKLEENKLNDYERSVESLKALQLDVGDNYKPILMRFNQDYYKYKYHLQNIVKKSNDLINEFEKLIEKARDVETNILQFQELNQENLKNKIWDLIKVYYENKHELLTNLRSNRPNVEIDDVDILLAICKTRQKLDDSDLKVIDLILKYTTPSTLFRKMEEDPKYAENFIKKNKKIISDKISAHKAQLKTLNTNVNFENDQKNIESIRTYIVELERSQDHFDADSSIIERILEDLDQTRKMVKEIYLKSLLHHELKQNIFKMIHHVIPQINQFMIAYKSTSNNKK